MKESLQDYIINVKEFLRNRIEDVREFLGPYARKLRWLLVGVIVLAAMNHAMTNPDYWPYVQNWGATLFKALNGGVIGWLISRYVIGMDLSEVAEDNRPTAALSQAILIAGFAIAVSNGA
jgi:hypothetical protein